MSEALTPCPFCGHDRSVLDRTDRFPDMDTTPDDEAAGRYAYAVRCVGCAAIGPWRKSREGAEFWWNRRSATTTEEAA